jgi:hypothetical protein
LTTEGSSFSAKSAKLSGADFAFAVIDDSPIATAKKSAVSQVAIGVRGSPFRNF